MVTDGINYTGNFVRAFGRVPKGSILLRPRTNDVALSLLERARNNGFTALVVTLDTMSLGWRPHDLERAYIPFGHGVGNQVGRSDPVFMGRYGRQPVHERPVFPYDAAGIDKRIRDGDEKAREAAYFGSEWLKECNSGDYRDWEDLKFLRDNWKGPLVLKGIQSVHVGPGFISSALVIKR